MSDAPVEKLTTVIKKDSSGWELQLPQDKAESDVTELDDAELDDAELDDASDVVYGPAPAPPGYRIPDNPAPLKELPKYGTAISWMPSLKDAIGSASEKEKLVFLLQVSGNFALEEFT